MPRTKTKPGTIDEATKPLAEEMRASDARDNEFAPARGKGPKLPRMPEDFERIVERVFSIDVHAQYDRLETIGKVGDGRSNRAVLTRTLDEAEDNARLAHQLYLIAKVDFRAWDIEVEVITSGMRTEATRELQKEKDTGVRSKQITDADVTSKMAALYPDEFGATETKRTRLKAMVDHLEKFAELWASRCRSLQAMLGGVR